MPFWGKKFQFWGRAESDSPVDDYDEYDPTPYGGGYNLHITYGRPLSPSEEICYPLTSYENVDYERPTYRSLAQHSAYAGGYVRPQDEEGMGHGGGLGYRYGGGTRQPETEHEYHTKQEEVGYEEYGGEEGEKRYRRPSYHGDKQEEVYGRPTSGSDKSDDSSESSDDE